MANNTKTLSTDAGGEPDAATGEYTGATASNVTVRFAPSPTGFLHIGGARTALFNWLYARAKGGRFVLRIEDTDRARHSEAAVAAILDGLKWLGLDADAEPVSQFARADRHGDVVAELLSAGHAYRCYLTADELAAMREQASKEGRPPIIVSPWRDRDPADAPTDQSSVVRLKTPNEGETVVKDHVQGDVAFPNKDLDDLIIQRSDGTATYNLAVVVDDHDMGVTHIIRGVDHLTNAARQTQIFDLLGWAVPQFAHVPLIHGPDGAKLSKRHGALGVERYRAMGYLPAALRNYLVRLGWSHGDDEIFSTEQAISWFDLDGIGKSPARFDVAKLEATNAIYIRQTDDQELVQRTFDILDEIEGGAFYKAAWNETRANQFAASMPGLKERAKNLIELINGARYLFVERPLELDKKATKLLNETARGHLAKLTDTLETLDTWTAATLEATVRQHAEDANVGLGKIAQPLRAAVTGSGMSPPIFDVLEVLGRDEALARLRDQVGS
ncbi:MAG: glutamate--tRNA ligase [Pseudomonadota bacterium]